MSVEEKILIQCQCGGDYRYSSEAIYTSPLKFVYKCGVCNHMIYVIGKSEGEEYNPHLGYKNKA